MGNNPDDREDDFLDDANDPDRGGQDELRSMLSSLVQRFDSIEGRLRTLEGGASQYVGALGGRLRPNKYGGYTIEFSRQLEYSIEDVFNVMTDPERMVDWYADADIEPREGGKLELRFANSGATAHAMVLEYDPPRKFAYMWVTGSAGKVAQPMPDALMKRNATCGDLSLAASVIRYELTSQGKSRTSLKLSHYAPLNPSLIATPLVRSARSAGNVSQVPAPDMVLATWDIALDMLEEALEHPGSHAMGLDAARRTGGFPWERFQDRRAMYAQTLG